MDAGMTITLIIVSIILAILSGLFNAVSDLSSEGKLKFKNEQYWIKSISSERKHQYNHKSKFVQWLMKNSAVFLTDGWHLFNLLFRVSFATLYTLLGLLISTSLWYLFGCLVAYIIFATSFHIFYTYKILKK